MCPYCAKKAEYDSITHENVSMQQLQELCQTFSRAPTVFDSFITGKKHFESGIYTFVFNGDIVVSVRRMNTEI